jgi:LacI family transcriptional regulator
VAGRAVPGDVAIVGFDDIPLAQEVTPRLTTVRIPLAEIGRRSAELLLAPEASTSDGGAAPVVLPVELIQRQSA